MIGNTKWIVPIMGFRESASQETGIETVWRALRPLSDPSVLIMAPYEWDEPMRDLVDFIYRNSPSRPEVMVIAYSWGCGVGFTRFAEAAAKVGLRIRFAVLCDPVWRSTWLPTWLPFNPLSISSWVRPAIRVPASVERVEWVRQWEDCPRGHDLVAEDPDRTHVGLGRYVLTGHRTIDDSREFQVLAEHWAYVFVHDLSPVEAGEPEVMGLRHRPLSRDEWMQLDYEGRGPREIPA